MTEKSSKNEAHRLDILNAAIEIFGRVGYAAASTNEIVKAANVSKGLLFHHFGNKENLYIESQKHVLQEYAKYMAVNLKFPNNDFFDRITYSMRIKMEFGCKNPEYLALINRAWHIDGDENKLLRSEGEAFVLEILGSNTPLDFFAGVDTSIFKPGMNQQKALDYTRLTLEAAWLRFTKKYDNNPAKMTKNLNEYFDEANEIVDLIKYGAYTTT
jgi:AcrR family transcriptional regulator